MTKLGAIAATVLLMAAPGAAQPSGAGGNLPYPPAEVLHLLRDEPFTIDESKGAGGGVMGALRWTLRFADGRTLKAKWKRAPFGADGWNNSPRLEAAAYAVQRLYLDPNDYVVPPATARCVPFDVYRPVDDDPDANLPDARCVFGGLSAWLDNVRVPEPQFDKERFSRDRRYARRFADLNLLTYLISHRDTRDGNILISEDEDNPQLFAVDNGISFEVWFWNRFARQMFDIRVGGLPRTSVERLRRVTPSDLAAFGVLDEFQRDSNGIYRAVEAGPNLDPDEGTRVVGERVQIGLTSYEIEKLGERLQQLLQRIDRGELPLF